MLSNGRNGSTPIADVVSDWVEPKTSLGFTIVNRGPRSRDQTIRAALESELVSGFATALELSRAVGASEKAVFEHLEHLRRSHAEHFDIEPASCRKCDFVFDTRERLRRPSRCPSCKSERLNPPRFRFLPPEAEEPHADHPVEIVQIEVGMLQNFCEVIACPRTGEAALVDPAFEVDRLLKVVRERQWTVTTILLTHTHDDHIAGLDEAAELTGALVRCHPIEVEIARSQAERVEAVDHEAWLQLGKSRVQALHTPGHTPGCVCWYFPEPGAIVTGDVLFVGSCGGVNYAQSDPAAGFYSLHHVLGRLPEMTRIYPGHDYGSTPTSTLAWERAHNPALTAPSLEAFCAHKGVPVPSKPS